MIPFLGSDIFKISSPRAGVKYYLASVAHGGNDNNAGTIASPWTSISKLNTVIGGLGASDSVFFYSGDTFTGQINAPGNGSLGSPVVITTYNGTAKAIINGFQNLTSGSWTSIGNSQWEASVNSGSFLNLVVKNGEILPMGRTPNAGSYYNVDSRIDDNSGFPPPGGFYNYSISSSSLNSAVRNWTGAIALVRSNDYNTDPATITGHTGQQLNLRYTIYRKTVINNKFHIQNDIRTLDQQNEWYYNPATQKLTMFSSTNPGNVSVGIYDYGFNIYNDTYSQKHDITLNNLSFTGQDSTGVMFVGTNNIEIRNCNFNYIGDNGINVDATNPFGNFSNNYVIIEGNDVRKIGNTGILSKFTNSTRVWYNYVDSCGIYEGLGRGNNQQHNGITVESSGTDSVSIIGNKVYHVGYCGIRWTGQKAYIYKNHVLYFCLQQTDGGGIYTSREGGDSATNYRVIRKNIVGYGYGNKSTTFVGGYGGAPSIYLDDLSVNVRIDSNTLYNSTRYSGPFFHNNRNIIFRNNVIYDSVGPSSEGRSGHAIGSEHDDLEPGYYTRGMDFQYNDIFVNNTLLLYLFTYENSDIASFGTINRNYYSRPSATNSWVANQNGSGFNFSSLPQWIGGFGYDLNSTFQIVSNDSMKLFTNPTLSPVQINLTNETYRDLRGENFNTIQLGPMEGKLLKKVTYIPGVVTNFIYTIPNTQKRRKVVKVR